MRDEGRNINIVMCGGAKIGNDAVRKEPVQHQWVKKNIEPPNFKEARQEFIKKNVASTSAAQHTKDVPTYEMSSSLDHTSEVHTRD